LPDIIIMDLSLPVMDGWEATRRLKADERTRRIPVVALTGHALAGHSKVAQEAGCDSFLAKPCLPDQLVAEIRRMLESGKAVVTTTKEQVRHARNREAQGSCSQVPERVADGEEDRQAGERGAKEPSRREGRMATATCGSSPRRAASMSTASSRRASRSGSDPWASASEPAEVHTVNYRDIAAVVSDTPIEVHDPTRENVLAHERVNETVMRKHTVIPMSFGTGFKTGDDIVELLRSAYDAFHDVLDKMQDKLEFGLKVLWDREVMVREIENQDEDVRRLKQEISAQKGSTYFARMQYGRLIDAALQAHSEKYVAEIVDRMLIGGSSSCSARSPRRSMPS